MSIFDKLKVTVREKLLTFDESGMGYWIVTAKLRDGRRFRNVFITSGFKFGFPDQTPFKLREIEDVSWDGYRGARKSAEPVLVSSD